LKKLGNDERIDRRGISKGYMLKLDLLNKFYIKFLCSSLKYKMVLASSKEVKKTLISAFLNKNVKITGYPRNDILFNRKLAFFDYKREFELNKYKKVLLYAPTWRDNYTGIKPFSNKGLAKLNSYLSKNNYLLLVKKHPAGKKISIPKNLCNIRDITFRVGDIQELLIFTNILITDYSSVFFDFVLLDRPIIYYPYDYEEYLENCRGMYYDYYKEIPGPFAKNEKKLLYLIKTVDKWFNDEAYQTKYKKFKNRFNYYQDGKSCERVYNLIMKEVIKK